MATLLQRSPSFAVRLAGAIDASLEQHFWRWGSLFLALLLGCSLVIDARTKMWIDELYTLHIVKQAGTSEIFAAILEGCDGQPPAYDLILRPILAVVHNEALAIRLPSTVGFCAMVLCLLVFCRRRLPAAYALLASLFVCDSCLYFATEGRAYGMVLGCAAGALLCWQSAVEGRRRGLALTLLGFCLSLMVALHYFAIFFLGPLLVAEAVRAWRLRRWDFGVLAVMAPACLVLALHYPFIAAWAKFEAHFWAPANWSGIERFYRVESHDLLQLFAAAMIVVALLARTPAKPVTEKKDLTLAEWYVMGGIVALPPVVIGIAIFTTHAFTEEYLIWVVIGLAVPAAALLHRAARSQTITGLAILGIATISFARHEIGSQLGKPLLRESESLHRVLDRLPDGPEPIAISDPHLFMELAWYEEPRIRRRLVYPASRELDVHYRGYDTDTISLLALRRRSDLPVVDLDAFLAGHPRFLLGAPAPEYLPWWLAGAGYRVTPVPPDATQPMVFQVEREKSEAGGSFAARISRGKRAEPAAVARSAPARHRARFSERRSASDPIPLSKAMTKRS